MSYAQAPFKLGVVTPTYQRLFVTDLLLRWYRSLWRNLRKELEVKHIVVYSRDEDDLSDSFPEFIWLRYPNKPVSDKWNYAMRQHSSWSPDATICIQSDDFLNMEYIMKGVDLIRSGKDFVKAGALYFYDVRMQKAMFCKATHIGACAMFSRYTMYRSNYQPWLQGLDRGIDAFLSKRLRRFKVSDIGVIPVKCMTKGSPAMIDVKSHENVEGELVSSNINSYSLMKRSMSGRIVEVDADSMFRLYFPSIREDILNLTGRLDLG